MYTIMDDRFDESQVWRDALDLLDDGACQRGCCPTASEIFDTVSGAAKASVRRRVVAHIARCSDCAQYWQCAQRILGDAPEQAALRS